MGLSDWIIIGGAAWLIKKGINRAAKERERQEESRKFIEEESRQFEEDFKKMRNELSRKAAIDRKRECTPCFFKDGISREEFCDIANRVGKKLNRVKKIYVNGAIVFCTVESQTGYSDWKFNVDFNDWGHITGVRWTWSENSDSNIPKHFGEMMASTIQQLLSDRNIYMQDYSDLVDKNLALETEEGLEFHNKKMGFIKKIFSKAKTIISQYDSMSLIGEHLYPVISCLKSNGFCNVKSVPIKDVYRGGKKFLFEVEQIVIDGRSFFEEGDTFNENSEVIITYHEKREIVIPFTEKHYIRRNYIDVGDELEALGFSEIYEHAIQDLTTGWLKRDGSVERVTIAEKELQKNAVYRYDDRVVIYYHTFKRKN